MLKAENDVKIEECNVQLSHINPKVEILNKKIADDEESILSNKEEISDLESEFELYYNSKDHTDDVERQIEGIKQKRDELIKENKKLIDSVKEELKQQRAHQKSRISELEIKKQELQNKNVM